MKERVLKNRIGVFDTNIEIVVTDDMQGSYDRRWDDKDDHTGSLGLCLRENKTVYAFFLTKGLTHDTIAHEVFHATCWVANRIGQPITRDHEPFAWVMGYITNLVYLCLKKAKIKPRIEK